MLISSIACQHDLLPEKKKQIKISPIDTVHTQSLGDYDKDKVPIGWVVSVDGENYRITLMY